MEGKNPDRPVAKYLVSQLTEKNYIPPNSVSDYEYAVLKLYREYFEGRKQSNAKEVSKEK